MNTVINPDHAPATLLSAAMKIMNEYRTHERNRDAQSSLLYRYLRAAESGDASQKPDHGPEELKKIVYAPTDPVRQVLCVETGLFRAGGDGSSANVSSIQTKIIQQAGRLCLHYASDILYDLAHVAEFAKGKDLQHVDPGYVRAWLVSFGLRENGSDHSSYVINRLKESTRGGPYVNVQADYRQYLAVLIEDTNDGDGMIRRTISLLDLTHDISRIDPADLKADTDEGGTDE